MKALLLLILALVIPPTPDHYVTDNAGALSSSARASIENELRAYETATGHQVIVWIGQSTGDTPLETYTGQVADHWKIGRHGKDDGAVLFLFMQDRKVRIEVGYGLESSLTDADSYRIINDVVRPRMRAGDVDGAVASGVAAMLTTITPSYAGVTPPPQAAESSNDAQSSDWIVVVGLIFFGLAILAVILKIVRAARYGYLVMHEGKLQAQRDMRRSSFWTGAFVGAMSTGGGGGWGGGGGGFSAGGGGFGGGGASGGW